MSDFSEPKANKRASADIDETSRKKSKKGDREGTYNPYLAHMDQESNGYGGDEAPPGSALEGMKRRQTTAAQASKAEDSAINPFTGKPHSQQYFRILETRRDLPVHKQRYADPSPIRSTSFLVYIKHRL